MVEIIRVQNPKVSLGCSLPPMMRISASPLEKTDARVPLTRGRVVPKRDSHSMKLGGNLQPNCGRTLAAPEQWLNAKKDLKPLRVQLQ